MNRVGSIALAMAMMASAGQAIAQDAEVIMRRPLPFQDGGSSTNVVPPGPTPTPTPAPTLPLSGGPSLTGDPTLYRDPPKEDEDVARLANCRTLQQNNMWTEWDNAGCGGGNPFNESRFVWQPGPWEGPSGGPATCGNDAIMERELFCFFEGVREVCADGGYGECTSQNVRFPTSTLNCVNFAEGPIPATTYQGNTAGCDYQITLVREDPWETGCTTFDSREVEYQCSTNGNLVDWDFCAENIRTGGVRPPVLQGIAEVVGRTGNGTGIVARVDGSSLNASCNFSPYGTFSYVGECSNGSAPEFSTQRCEVQTGGGWWEDVDPVWCNISGGQQQTGTVQCEASYSPGNLLTFCGNGNGVPAAPRSQNIFEITITNGRYIDQNGNDWGPGSSFTYAHNDLVNAICTDRDAVCCMSASRPGMNVLNVTAFEEGDAVVEQHSELPVQFGTYVFGHARVENPVR